MPPIMDVLKTIFIALSIIDLNVAQIKQVEIKPENIDDIFRFIKIVPNEIPYSPADILHVKYPETIVNYGNMIEVLYTLIPPKVSWNDTDEDAEPDSLYTLFFVNLDIGDPYFLHWMVSNIHQGNLMNASVTMGYKFPDPPMNGNIPYRMLFLVYRQPELEPYPYNAKSFLGHVPNRGLFSINDFLTSYNFSEFPVAGNYFLQETRISAWHPINPPDWMKPFIPYLKEHPHGIWEMMQQ